MKKTYEKSDYAKKLEHPLWQKKRLEVFNRDGFTCQVCHSDETQLHCHHLYYDRAKEPWEYPNDAFRTLCKNCHKDETEGGYPAQKRFIEAAKLVGLDHTDFNAIAERLESYAAKGGTFHDFDRVTIIKFFASFDIRGPSAWPDL